MNIYFNFNHQDGSILKVGTMLMDALCRRADITRVTEPDQADVIFDCEPRMEKIKGKFTVWWDNEACNDHCLNGYDYDLILAPYTSRLDQYPLEKTYFFPFATEPREFYRVETDYRWDAGFAGREDLDRVKRVEYLDYFQKNFKGSFLRTLGVPRGHDTSELMSQVKVILQVAGDALKGVMETRVFEMGGIGLLAIDRSDINADDLDWYAKADYHYISYKSKPELVEKVTAVVNDEKLWKAMRDRGIQNVLERHTYDVRAQQLVDHLKGKKLLRRLV